MKYLKAAGCWLGSLGLAMFTAHYMDTHAANSMGFVVLIYGTGGAFAAFMAGLWFAAEK